MVSELSNQNSTILSLIYNTVFISDSAGPITGEAMFQGLRFTYSLIWHSLDITNKTVDSV